jgi:pilus assembly protein CpaE
MARNPKVVVIDGNLEGRSELHKLLSLAHIAVLGEAGYGVDAQTLVEDVQPDVALVGLEEPVARGLQTLEALSASFPQLPMIVYSSLADGGSVRRAMLAGARDYLTQPLDPETVTNSIKLMLDQEEHRQKRASGQSPQIANAGGTVITVFGAKGGIGKTTIATNLATAIHKETGQTVALVDMDTRFGDVAIMMDIPVDRNIADLARRLDTVDRTNIREYLVQHPCGVGILPAPSHPGDWNVVTPDHIEQVVRLLAQTHDFVILDTPGTFNEMVAAALEMATVVLLVTSMDVASIKDTVLALNMLRSWSFPREKVKLTINHANVANSVKDKDVERTLEYEVFWQIPYDETVTKSTQLGQPIVLTKPGSKVGSSLIDLARTMGGAKLKPKSGGAGAFMSRFLRRAS